MAEPRFRFRAAVVLDLRRRRDRDAQDALAVANSAYQRAEEALGAARQAVSAACGRPADAEGDRDWYRNWMGGLRASVAQREAELADRDRERGVALAHAVACRSALKAIERLRDRRLEAFELEVTRREQRQIDELGTQRHRAAKTAPGGTS
jgi:flagellar export protein FliJ